MKLWVDDVRDAPDDTWHVARTINEAIRCLYRFKSEIKEISLDHDIGHMNVQTFDELGIGRRGKTANVACTEMYQAVAYYIAELWMLERNLEVNGYKDGLHIMSPGITPKIYIHSANPDGAERLKEILKESGIEAELKPVI